MPISKSRPPPQPAPKPSDPGRREERPMSLKGTDRSSLSTGPHDHEPEVPPVRAHGEPSVWRSAFEPSPEPLATRRELPPEDRFDCALVATCSTSPSSPPADLRLGKGNGGASQGSTREAEDRTAPRPVGAST